jgi:ectoine hydroxylase-related dioxygenase (phytanoyl-CoA dioxygenase family)
LGDVPSSLGGLAVQPGSQRSSRVHVRPLNGHERGWLSADYRAGDVLVFHCLTTHAALPNREPRMRFSAEYRWQLADQPAPRRMIIGPNGFEIGSRIFGRKSWWRSVLDRVTLFDGGGVDSAAILPAAPSRFVQFTN